MASAFADSSNTEPSRAREDAVGGVESAVFSEVEGGQANPGGSTEVPGWFRSKRGSKPGQPPARTRASQGNPLVQIRTDSTAISSNESWKSRLCRAVRGAFAGGLGLSLLLHAVALFALSLVLIQQADRPEPFSTIVTEAEGGPLEFAQVVELSLPMAGADLNQAPELTKLPFDASRPTFTPDVIADVAMAAGKPDGALGGDADGFLFKMPTGGKSVVRKGSFAAWTVPEDPKPREDYKIIIRIQLPPGTRQYRVGDISGNVIGTDDFTLSIPFDRRRPDASMTERRGKLVPVRATDLLQIVDNHVQIIVNVPGAASLVRDAIELKSKLLKEQQRLEIVF